MQIVLLDAITLGEIDHSVFEQLGDLIVYQSTKAEEIISRCENADIIITNKCVLCAKILKQLPNLKLIQLSATGMDNIDTAYCDKNGIEVYNVKDYSTDSVAQHTLTLVLAMLSELIYYQEYTLSGEWARQDQFTHLGRSIKELSASRWGIIGMGAIGKKVAKIAQSFGADVVYHSTSGLSKVEGIEQVSLETLLKTSDIISLHCPLNQMTKNLISTNEFALMKNDALLVNVARGAVLDQNALIKKMKESAQFKVALDVTSPEPLESEHPLYDFCTSGRLLITPHIAWASDVARQSLFNIMLTNIQNWLSLRK